MKNRTSRIGRIAAIAAMMGLLVSGAAHISAQASRAAVDLSSDTGRFELADHIEELVRDRRDLEIEPAGYARRYGQTGPGASEPDTDLVYGVYENMGPNIGAVTWTDEALVPSIDDGGCAAVELTYSINRDEIVSIRCNGVA
ncbi:hypothetical protein [Parasphingopyxis marina]|uniref:Uncharacterized protein n=1 Tax=Parasphingopyxis marina TaxID=2761622 RepID=A0A842HV51_9SPHN|nr:hypothetical protein [Parasphingopyxis marina]MBC2777888.1 hypothetical protein [Parasphingopyxis marina]